MAVVLASVGWSPPVVAAEPLLFRGVDADGAIYAVRSAGSPGRYTWFLGTAGEFSARLDGARVYLQGRAFSATVQADADGETVMRIGGNDSVLQEDSLGFGCFAATLQHAGVEVPRPSALTVVFKDSTADGSLWSVRFGGEPGRYAWYLGAMGRAEAHVSGTTVRLQGEVVQATVHLSNAGEVVLSPVGGSEGATFVPGSVGYGCYQATLEHHGTWREPAANRRILFQNASTDGSLWSVASTDDAGRYVWHMGPQGKAGVTVQGTTVRLVGDLFVATIHTDSSNQVVVDLGGARTVFQEGSLGYGCYQATLEHFGSWRPGLGVQDYVFRTVSQDGAMWSVLALDEKGRYQWSLGGMGEATARVSGTTVQLEGPGLWGQISVSADNEVALRMGGQELVFQQGSLGYGCYAATLQHHGSWQTGLGVQDYIFRTTTADGSLWAVKATGERGRYVMYLGSMGRVSARLDGETLRLQGDALVATIARDARGDLVLDVGYDRSTLLVGSAGAACYAAIFEHHRSH